MKRKSVASRLARQIVTNIEGLEELERDKNKDDKLYSKNSVSILSILLGGILTVFLTALVCQLGWHIFGLLIGHPGFAHTQSNLF